MNHAVDYSGRKHAATLDRCHSFVLPRDFARTFGLPTISATFSTGVWFFRGFRDGETPSEFYQNSDVAFLHFRPKQDTKTRPARHGRRGHLGLGFMYARRATGSGGGHRDPGCAVHGGGDLNVDPDEERGVCILHRGAETLARRTVSTSSRRPRPRRHERRDRYRRSNRRRLETWRWNQRSPAPPLISGAGTRRKPIGRGWSWIPSAASERERSKKPDEPGDGVGTFVATRRAAGNSIFRKSKRARGFEPLTSSLGIRRVTIATTFLTKELRLASILVALLVAPGKLTTLKPTTWPRSLPACPPSNASGFSPSS